MSRYVITLTRANSAAKPLYEPTDEQSYLIQISRSGQVAGPVREASLPWGPLNGSLRRIQRLGYSPHTSIFIGQQLQNFLHSAGWHQYESEIRKELDQNQMVHITLVSNAAELYRLPWELLILDHPRIHLGAHEQVIIGYAWPTDQANTELDRSMSRIGRPSRIIMICSAAGGPIPKDIHIDALTKACSSCRYVDFQPERDVINAATIGRIKEVLRKVQATEQIVLHILCHGASHQECHGLILNSFEGAPTYVSPSMLSQALAPHRNNLQLVTLCACSTANPGDTSHHSGSLTQAIHRIGIPWVVGARYPLPKVLSAVFVRGFYEKLLGPYSIEQAFSYGRLLVFEELGDAHWNNLQLYAADRYRGLNQQLGIDRLRTSLDATAIDVAQNDSQRSLSRTLPTPQKPKRSSRKSPVLFILLVVVGLLLSGFLRILLIDDTLNSTPNRCIVIWGFVGTVFVFAEFLVSGIAIFLLGVSAFAVASLISLIPALGFLVQFILWIIFSSGLAAGWLRFVTSGSRGEVSLDTDEIVGYIISTNKKYGIVRFSTPLRGQDEWPCVSFQQLRIGDRVVAAKFEGETLEVEILTS